MKRTRLIAVGACAIDTVLTVPHFPEEDSKLCASSLTRRRGGNCPNTLEVLQQLTQLERDDKSSSPVITTELVPELFLIATLPSRKSAQISLIDSSFDRSHISTNTTTSPMHTPTSSGIAQAPRVDLSHCVYREDFTEPVSSYIISSQSTSSRTIMNHNTLPEMTREEFVSLTRDLLRPSPVEAFDQVWFHFEGRIPDTTLDCIRYLRDHDIFKAKANPPEISTSQLNLKISVEVEKPGRPGLQDLAHEADVVFYSKAWTRSQNYETAEMCLRQQAEVLSAKSSSSGSHNGGRLLICPWGAQGASALVLPRRSSSSSPTDLEEEWLKAKSAEIFNSPAYVSPNRPIIDTTGAGDTFIAGILFGLLCRGAQTPENIRSWSLQQTLDFANALAGRKILQDGFRGLAELVRPLRDVFDSQ